MKTAIRNVVHSFYSERVNPNLHMIWVHCCASVKDFPDMSETTSWRTLRSMKLAYRKRKGEGLKLVSERLDIVAWRHRFLRRLRHAKEDARPFVYLYETWVNAHHAISHTWYDDSAQPTAVTADLTGPPEPPQGKGRRLIVLHAGSSARWVDNWEDIFVGKKKTGDYPAHSSEISVSFQAKKN